MTYRHIMTKNYMTYDIKFSHIVAALAYTETSWCVTATVLIVSQCPWRHGHCVKFVWLYFKWRILLAMMMLMVTSSDPWWHREGSECPELSFSWSFWRCSGSGWHHSTVTRFDHLWWAQSPPSICVKATEADNTLGMHGCLKYALSIKITVDD